MFNDKFFLSFFEDSPEFFEDSPDISCHVHALSPSRETAQHAIVSADGCEIGIFLYFCSLFRKMYINIV